MPRNPAIPHCDQCQMLNINGVNCHETGCPNAKKTWMPDREAWVRFVECFICGDEVEQGEACGCQEMEPDEPEPRLPFCTDVRCTLPTDHTGPCEEEEEID